MQHDQLQKNCFDQAEFLLAWRSMLHFRKFDGQLSERKENDLSIDPIPRVKGVCKAKYLVALYCMLHSL